MRKEVQRAMGERVVALTEEELGSLFLRAQNGDLAALDAALEALEPLTAAVSRRYKARLSRDTALGPDDLIQQGRLYAIMAIKRWGGRDTPPGAYITMSLRSALHQWAGRAGDLNGAVFSLDWSTGEGEGPVSELVSDPALTDSSDFEDAELEGLLNQIPRGEYAAGDEYLTLRLNPGPPRRLPDDLTLANLVRQGKTTEELLQMFGGARTTLKERLTTMRKSGIAVPKGKRQAGIPCNTAMRLTPWPEKLRIITEYLTSHPGVSNNQAQKDLGTSTHTLHRARQELAQAQG